MTSNQQFVPTATQPRQAALVTLGVFGVLYGLGQFAAAVMGCFGVYDDPQALVGPSSADRIADLWRGASWAALVTIVSAGLVRGREGARAVAFALVLWGWLCLLVQFMAVVHANGSTASTLLGAVACVLLLALGARALTRLGFGGLLVGPWLPVTSLGMLGWVWTALILPAPLQSRASLATDPGWLPTASFAVAATMWLAAMGVARRNATGAILGLTSTAGATVLLLLMVGRHYNSSAEQLAHAAFGGGAIGSSGALAILATHFATAAQVFLLLVHVPLAVALLTHSRLPIPRTADRAEREMNVPPSAGVPTLSALKLAEANTVGVPRRFGIGTIMIVTTAFAALLAFLRWLNIGNFATACAVGFVAALGFAQLLLGKGRTPRAASVIAGGAFLHVAFGAGLLEINSWQVLREFLKALPAIGVIGGILGYVGGTMMAGMFLIMQRVRGGGQVAESAAEVVVEDNPFPRRWKHYLPKPQTLLAAAVALLALWGCVQVHPAREQSRRAAKLREQGISVGLEAAVPAWLNEVFGKEYFAWIRSVSFPHDRLLEDDDLRNLRGLKRLEHLNIPNIPSDAALAPIAELQDLRSLVLHGENLTDVGMQHLQGLTQLDWLSLNAPAITDEGLRNLRQMTKLHTLGLHCPAVTDDGLAALSGMLLLRHMGLSGTQVTGAGFAQLSRLPWLQWVDLSGSAVTDDGLTGLRGLISLTSLDLSNTSITGEGLSHLTGSTGLTSLLLSGTPVTSEGLRHVGALASLNSLDLSNTPVTNSDLSHLKAMPALQGLTLTGTPVSDAGLAYLPPTITSLNLSNTAVTDAGLVHLSKLRSLQYLDLSGTDISDAGLKHLAAVMTITGIKLNRTAVTDAGIQQLSGLPALRQLELIGTEVTADGLRRLRSQVRTLYIIKR